MIEDGWMFDYDWPSDSVTISIVKGDSCAMFNIPYGELMKNITEIREEAEKIRFKVKAAEEAE